MSSKKKKGADPNAKTCAHCHASEASDVKLSACSRCGLVFYCGKECQRAHWKPAHKQQCVAKADRAPPTPKIQAASAAARKAALAAAEGEECAICLEALKASSALVLPCNHVFHSACVEGLRKFGLKSVCPICRGELPPGFEQQCDEAIRRLSGLWRCRYENKKEGVWKFTSQADRNEINEVIQLLSEVCASANKSSIEYALASNSLGTIYFEGCGVDKDEKIAFNYHKAAAEAGLGTAQANLAMCYDFGNGVKQSDAEALIWYTKAAEQGVGLAQVNLARKYEDGEGIPVNVHEAFKWYQQAAEDEVPFVSASAHNSLGRMYEEGGSIKKDISLAVLHFHQSAVRGSAEGENNLGKMYANGKGVKKDVREAVKWYKRAAEQGYPLAWGNLGNRYLQGGDGVTQSITEAAKCWRKAADACAALGPTEFAEEPLVDASFNLGICYYNGQGVAKNRAEAKRLLCQAASRGHPQAKALLKTLN